MSNDRPAPLPVRGVPLAEFADACVLVVDDEESNLLLLTRILRRAGYERVHAFSDPREAVARLSDVTPDIVLLDLHMPGLNGLEMMDAMHGMLDAKEFVPMLMLTGDDSPETRQQALAHGANDFVNKPFETVEVLLRIRNLLHTRALHRELRERNEQLEVRVHERTAELEQARLDILDRLARAGDFRDDATGEHTRRVGALAERIALELGMPQEEASRLGRAAMLHDIGKIGIPDGILLKPFALTDDEFDIIRDHVRIGRDILAGRPGSMLHIASTIAFTHHERWDGTGYNGMKGEEIPLEGRIVTVADTFDVLVNERPYRKPCTVGEALEEMRSCSGTQFDPHVLDAFLRVIEREQQA